VRSAWSARGWSVYLGWVVITLDGSALNLALPRITSDLGSLAAGASWVVDAYTLPLAALLLLGGSLGDRVGAERLFRVGAIGFAAASSACALSPSLGVLVVCRAGQGVFAAMLLPMVLALVGKSFEDPGQRSTAVNLMTVFGGAGMAAGPFLGGLLTDTIGWRAVFWLTAPIAIAAAALVGTADRLTRQPHTTQFDVAGQFFGTAGLVAVVAGLIEAGRSPGALLTWALLAVGVLLLVGFIVVEHRARAPMMPLSVFRTVGFPGAVFGGFAFQFGAYGLQFFLALYVQAAWGTSALMGGLLLAPFAIGTVLAGALVNPHLQQRGSRHMILIGATTAAVGTLLLLGATTAAQWWVLMVGEFVIGAGTAVYSTALNSTASAALGARSAGLASGIYNTSRQVGQSVGIAVLGTLAAFNDLRSGLVVAVVLITACAVAIGATGLRRPVRALPHSRPPKL